MAEEKPAEVTEITLDDLVPEEFVEQEAEKIMAASDNGRAINALSGGVDSSVVTAMAHRALGKGLETYFIDTGLMREGEPKHIVGLFEEIGIPVKLIDAQEEFFAALKGKTDPEEKRNAITHTFYSTVFGNLVRESGIKFLLHGTNYTDVAETKAGVKRQHNILKQLGIDPEKEYGYRVHEPLERLRKPAIRVLGKHLELPSEIYERPPFPGPGLSIRVLGEVTPERVAVVRAATKIVEEELCSAGAFQYLAILQKDKATGMHVGEGGKMQRDYGMMIQVRCWDSEDATRATPTNLGHEREVALAKRIVEEVPGVVSVVYNKTPKPPCTIEAE